MLLPFQHDLHELVDTLMKAKRKTKPTIPARVVKRIPVAQRGASIVFRADTRNVAMAPMHDPFAMSFAE